MARQSRPREGIISGVFTDIETGGLDCKVHGVTEVAAVAFSIDLSRINTDSKLKRPTPPILIQSSMQTYVKPNKWLAYCPGALGLQSYVDRTTTLEFLEAHGREEIAVVGLLQSFMHHNIYPSERYWNHQIWAQNSDFDHGFLYAMQKRVQSQCSEEPDTKVLAAKGLTPFGKVEMFSDRCDWSCTRKLFASLGARGIGTINNLGKQISLKDSMAYYEMPTQQTHSALQDCRDGIQVLAYMLKDEMDYYKGFNV